MKIFKSTKITEKKNEASFYKSTRIVAKNLPSFLKESAILEFFSKRNPATDVFMLKNKEGKFRRMAFIGYSTPEEAEEAVKFYNENMFRNHKITVEMGEPKNVSKDEETTLNKKSKYARIFYIQNLQNIDIESLRNDVASYLFEKHKKLVRHNISEEDKGYKIEFESHDIANDFYKNKKIICGRRVKVVVYDEDLQKKQFEHFNTLFFDFNMVLNNTAEFRNIEKDKIVDVEDKSLGVKMAILEASLVEKTKLFLEKNSVFAKKKENIVGIDKCKVIMRCEHILDVIGQIEGKIKTFEISPSKTLAIVVFEDEKTAEKIQRTFNFKKYKNGIIYVEFAPKINSESAGMIIDEKLKTKANCICIKNLPFQATKEDLKELFGVFCKVVDVRVPKKEDGSSRGFAFCVFENNASVEKIIEVFGISVHLYGRKLIIQKAQK